MSKIAKYVVNIFSLQSTMCGYHFLSGCISWIQPRQVFAQLEFIKHIFSVWKSFVNIVLWKTGNILSEWKATYDNTGNAAGIHVGYFSFMLKLPNI